MAASYNVVLETGDVLLFKRRGVVGWGITLFTGGDRCHAEIAVNGWGRHWSIGANATGMTMRPVSNLLRTDEFLRVRRIPASYEPTPTWQEELTECAIGAVGVVRYDYAKLFANAFPNLFRQGRRSDPGDMPRGVICSEWCSLLLRQIAKFDPCPQCQDQWTKPDDLDRKSRLVTVCDKLVVAPVEGV
jgi:hypothetical protein